MIPSCQKPKDLMNAALGQNKSDIAIINANLVNVYSGEILNRYSIGIKGEWIAYVGVEHDHLIGNHTTVIDAQDRMITPGLIEGHTHLAWLYSIDEFLTYAIPGGTTLVITETLEPYPIAGLSGVIDFLESFKNQPIKIFGTAPFMASISKRANGILLPDLQTLLERDDIIGIGESYWQSAMQHLDHTLSIYKEALTYGKSLEGHSAGASGKKLAAYAAAGISSCHEPINTNEVMEKLRMGFYVMIREGSIRSDLETISQIKNQDIDFRRLILVTDGIEPIDLMEKGHMDHIVQKAIDLGFNPIHAIQMATLNVAEHFSIDHIVGGIAPGRYADLLILSDIYTIKPECVISNGKIVSEHGNLKEMPRKHTFSAASNHTVQLPVKLKPDDFKIRTNNKQKEVNVRVIRMVTDLVTREHITQVIIDNNEIKANSDQDIIKVAAVDRAIVPGKTFVGLIKGFRLKSGAFACSAAWDTSDLIVIGVNDDDMVQAINRIHTLQGGVVVCNNGEVLAEIALPVFGIMSEKSIPELVESSKRIRKTLHNLGVTFTDPVLSLITLTGAAIPFIRICEEGLVNLKDGKAVDLFV